MINNQTIDLKIGELERQIGKIFTYLEQETNSYKNGNPIYWYQPHIISLSECIKELETLQPDESPLGKLLEEKIRSLILRLEAISVIGKPEFTQRCLAYFQNVKPSETELEEAKRILSEEEPIKEKNKVETFSATQLKDLFEKTLTPLGIYWKTTIVDPGTKEISKLSIHKHSKEIIIRADYKATERKAKKSILHESTHILRAENGLIQPLPNTFFFELDGKCNRTEEGITKFIEKQAGLLEGLRTSAAYVFAVDAMLRGASYTDILNLMKQYGLTEINSKIIARRVKRGIIDTSRSGGFPQDSAYLLGLLSVEDYLKKGGNIEIFYTGCIGIEHVPKIEQLLQESELNSPKYLPSQINL